MPNVYQSKKQKSKKQKSKRERKELSSGHLHGRQFLKSGVLWCLRLDLDRGDRPFNAGLVERLELDTIGTGTRRPVEAIRGGFPLAAIEAGQIRLEIRRQGLEADL